MKGKKTIYYTKSIKNITTIVFQVFEWLNRGVPVLIGIFFFFNPFPHITAIKEICYYLSVFIVTILFLFKKNDISFKTPFLIPVGLFFIWTFLGLFFAVDKNNSIHDFYAHFIRYILIYYILINYFDSKKRIVGLSWIIIVSSCIFAIGAVSYFHFILGNELSKRFIGFTQVPVGVFGVVTAVAAIFCINIFFYETNIFRKIILLICFLAIFFLIVLSQTFSLFIPLCIVILLLFFNYNKKMFIVVSSALIVIFIMSPFKNRFVSYYSQPLIALRVGIDYNTFEVIKDYPIIGIGFGMETFKNAIDLKKYHERVPKKYREDFIYNDPHNIFFDIAVRLGVVGIVLFFYIIISYFKLCWIVAKHGKDDFAKNWGLCLAGAFFTFLFVGLFHPIFSHKPEAILCVMFSMLTIVTRLYRAPIPK